RGCFEAARRSLVGVVGVHGALLLEGQPLLLRERQQRTLRAVRPRRVDLVLVDHQPDPLPNQQPLLRLELLKFHRYCLSTGLENASTESTHATATGVCPNVEILDRHRRRPRRMQPTLPRQRDVRTLTT